MWLVVRLGCGAAVLAGLAGLAVLIAARQLPALLAAAVGHVAPDVRLEVAGARLDARGRLELRRVRLLATATDEPILEADRIVVRASPRGLSTRRLDEVRLEGAIVTIPSGLPGGDAAAGGGAAGWHVGRLVSRGTRLHIQPRGDAPPVSCRVDLDLRELGTDPQAAERVHRIVVKDVVVGSPPVPLLRMRGGVIEASIAGLSERHHLDTARLVEPGLTIAGALPAMAGGAGADAGPGWSVGRLLITDGHVLLPGAGNRASLDTRLAADLRDLGTDPERAARPHEVELSRVTASLPGGAGALEADQVRVRASLDGLSDHRIDEVALRGPLVTAGSPAQPTGRPVGREVAGRGRPTAPATAPGGDAAASWTVARVVTYDGRLDLRPSATTPGVRGGFQLDLRDVGFDPAHAERLHRVQLREVHVRYPGHPASVVVDAGTIAFTMAGLRDRREFARLDVASGVVVLDRMLREQLAGGGDDGRGGGIGGWSIARVDLDRLGIRISDLGEAIPDVTLLVRTTMRDVPLGGLALREARRAQRVELSHITLNSPLDPFRPVVEVGSLFAEFSIADLLQRQIASLTIVSPTIYLGEDLVWFKDAVRRPPAQAGAGGGGEPWTVRHLRVELGRIVVTYNGVDRASVPLAFRTDARHVVLGDLATLRLAAALEVPRQDYRFPGFDLDLLGIEGELRFDYPPHSGNDNVVNTLRVDTIRWRDYRITDGWLSATFDGRGINGSLGGSAYDGYVNGGLSIPYTAGTMAGWAASTDLDLAPLAATVAGKYLQMEGVVDVGAAVEADGARIERAGARLDFTRPGMLRFPSLDTLLSKLPADTPSWQRDLARAAVQAFADYPYTSGGGTLSYVYPRGEAHLALAGARGKRRFDINYRQDEPTVVGTADGGER
jgi:hypothetical protein